jgi:hypothetical protein
MQIRFDDGKFDSYTLTLEKETLKLDCYLAGSITGGTGTECGHTISGEKMTQFLRAAGVKDLAGNTRLIRGHGAKRTGMIRACDKPPSATE